MTATFSRQLIDGCLSIEWKRRPGLVPTTSLARKGCNAPAARDALPRMPTAVATVSRSAVFDALLSRIGPRFARVEPRQRARLFVEGILSGPARKNGWTLAEYAGESDPNG